MNERTVQVICLCAGWCGVCRDYGAVFDAASTAWGPSASFKWVDIEDDAALLEDIDIDDFPTLLIASATGQPLFFGPITPQPATLARLVQGALDGDLQPLASAAESEALVRRVRLAGA